MVAALLLTACGVMRGDQESGLHRLRVMVPNSPGGGYDLTARTLSRPSWKTTTSPGASRSSTSSVRVAPSRWRD